MAEIDPAAPEVVAAPDDAALERLADSCVVVDLETEDRRIRDAGAVRGTRVFRLRDLGSSGDALDRLGEFGRGARFVLGHNIVAHDRRFVEIHRPDAELLQLPLIDTLYLAPLAFPQRPYHCAHQGLQARRRAKRPGRGLPDLAPGARRLLARAQGARTHAPRTGVDLPELLRRLGCAGRDVAAAAQGHRGGAGSVRGATVAARPRAARIRALCGGQRRA